MLGDNNRALEDYSEALKLNPSSAVNWSNRGRIYHKIGKYRTAILDYDAAISVDSESAIHYLDRGISKSWSGVPYFENHEAAIVDFTKAIELDPLNSVAYYFRGNSYDWLTDLEGDMEHYHGMVADNERACNLRPSYC